MIGLREYQQRTLSDLYTWFNHGNKGNPCIQMPTGSGKSHIIAALCKDAISNWPETHILMLTHVKELIEQNLEKLKSHWQYAPVGVYSAGMNSKNINQITFAGIQSIRDKGDLIGHVDLIIVDECHLISHKAEGSYRALIDHLKNINPHIRVIGLTATPWRLGHGLITQGSALFDDILEPVSIQELIYKGYLSPLKSKLTQEQLDTTGVKKRGGEYIESQLQKAVNKKKNNAGAVDEVIRLAEDRKAWLFFCAGVEHAQNVRQELQDRGIPSATITGGTPKKERERIIAEFKSGKIKALTNANVLTTGFDYPGIDLIAMLRPTMSPVLYVQMAGRGMRVAEGKEDCLVLDFAGVVQSHGPITAVQPPKKKGDSKGDAPVKLCEKCNELCHLAAKVCPSCGTEFPPPEKPKAKLHNDDIMGLEGIEKNIKEWSWRTHISRTSGKPMLTVSYYSDCLNDKPIKEYYPITHSGYAGQKAMTALADIARKADALGAIHKTALEDIADHLNAGNPPNNIKYKKDGKFYRVLERTWA